LRDSSGVLIYFELIVMAEGCCYPDIKRDQEGLKNWQIERVVEKRRFVQLFSGCSAPFAVRVWPIQAVVANLKPGAA
jgi:hypothetical protein